MGAPNIDSSKKTDKIMRMVEYLAALARIDRKTIRDVGKYERIVWLHEIPREPRHCFVQAWGVEDEGGEGAWITVEKFQEPRLPAPPGKCRDWIESDSHLGRVEVVLRGELRGTKPGFAGRAYSEDLSLAIGKSARRRKIAQN
jgi:hypothetical protein